MLIGPSQVQLEPYSHQHFLLMGICSSSPRTVKVRLDADGNNMLSGQYTGGTVTQQIQDAAGKTLSVTLSAGLSAAKNVKSAAESAAAAAPGAFSSAAASAAGAASSVAGAASSVAEAASSAAANILDGGATAAAKAYVYEGPEIFTQVVATVEVTQEEGASWLPEGHAGKSVVGATTLLVGKPKTDAQYAKGQGPGDITKGGGRHHHGDGALGAGAPMLSGRHRAEFEVVAKSNRNDEMPGMWFGVARPSLDHEGAVKHGEVARQIGDRRNCQLKGHGMDSSAEFWGVGTLISDTYHGERRYSPSRTAMGRTAACYHGGRIYDWAGQELDAGGWTNSGKKGRKVVSAPPPGRMPNEDYNPEVECGGLYGEAIRMERGNYGEPGCDRTHKVELFTSDAERVKMKWRCGSDMKLAPLKSGWRRAKGEFCVGDCALDDIPSPLGGFDVGDKVGLLLDVDAGTLDVSKNGVLQGRMLPGAKYCSEGSSTIEFEPAPLTGGALCWAVSFQAPEGEARFCDPARKQLRGWAGGGDAVRFRVMSPDSWPE